MYDSSHGADPHRKIIESPEPILEVIQWAKSRGFAFERGCQPGEMLVLDTLDRNRILKRLTDSRYRLAPRAVSQALLAHLQAVHERRR